MKRFNVINDNTVEIEDLQVGKLYVEKNMHGEVVNNYLLHPPQSESSILPIHLKMGTFKSIYLPVINYTSKIPAFRSELSELNIDELVLDIKLMTKELLNNENLILLADESVSGLYVDSLMGRNTKFKKVILYCKGKVNWNDVIYDWKDLTDNLRVIIGENQLYQSNLVTPYEDLANLRPPLNLRDQFNLEIEIQVETDGEIELSFNDEINPIDNNRLCNAKWKDVVNALRPFTTNLFYCNLNNSDIIANYNTIDDFNPKRPVVIITQKEVTNYRRKKDMDIRYLDLEFDPIVDILFKSIENYRKAFIELYG